MFKNKVNSNWGSAQCSLLASLHMYIHVYTQVGTHVYTTHQNGIKVLSYNNFGGFFFKKKKEKKRQGGDGDLKVWTRKCSWEATKVLTLNFHSFSSGHWKVFTGNELAALFGWWMFDCWKKNKPNADVKNVYMLATTVSSKILKAIALKEGFHFEVRMKRDLIWSLHTTFLNVSIKTALHQTDFSLISFITPRIF